ncbi:MAG: dephospho-CoA kinase [Armatimonadaceae bacterium]
MNVWAITGGIACGKSTVADLLRRKGYLVHSADDDARVVAGDPLVRSALAQRFPECFVEGQLDRRRLADRIYTDSEARQALNAIMHPAIRKRMRAHIEASRTADAAGPVFYEVPLLYEGGLENWFDGVVVVRTSPETQVERLRRRERDAGRPDLDPDEAKSRLAAQMDPAEKARRADFVVDTDRSLSDVEGQLERILAVLAP